jgi:thioredoxin 1
MSNEFIKEFTEQNFDETVIKSDKPVLVDFWAVWCGPCRAIAPHVESLAESYNEKAIVGKVDIDSQPGLAQKYNIRGVPTLLMFKDGEVVDQIVGQVPKAKLESMIESTL